MDKYLELEKRIIDKDKSPEKVIEAIYAVRENKIAVPEVAISDILEKLNNFEQKKGFLKKGFTQQELAKSFNTNITYLSFVINEFKAKNFNTYLNELRIHYIIYKLYHNPDFLKYTIEGLIKERGITSRQNFSDLFSGNQWYPPNRFYKAKKKRT
ncbi:hypothetical protein [Chryseobacterium sp.]|uniref:hypothetical protein n=1 Tax=Chryseobacterium sp. TaxID=1871047 RepID=UPI002FC9658B